MTRRFALVAALACTIASVSTFMTKTTLYNTGIQLWVYFMFLAIFNALYYVFGAKAKSTL